MSSDRPRLLLHIGTPRTGVGAIQSALEACRERLAADGVQLSLRRRGGGKDAAAVAREREALLASFADSGASTLLISDDGLSDPEADAARRFEPLAERFDIEVICFLRRQDLFVETLFNQYVRESVRRESRPILTFARAPATRARLDYHALLSRWSAITAKVRAFDFDSDAVQEQGLIPSFEAALGLRALGLPDHRATPSPDMRLALLLNRMNRLRMSYELTPLLHASKALAHAGVPPVRHLLGSDERRRLLAEYDAGNARLEADFGVRFSTELPPHEPACAVEDLDAGFTLQLLAGLSQVRQPAAGVNPT